VRKDVLDTYQWYHVAATHDGTTLKLYVNGNIADTDPAAGYVRTNTYPVAFGKASYGTTYAGEYFDGILDEVCIYNRALTDAEIQCLYEQP
jgi:hypothetical protein